MIGQGSLSALLPMTMATLAVVVAQPAHAHAVVCAAAPSPLILAPPIDRRMRMLVTTIRPASDGTQRTFGMEYHLVFQAAGRGLQLHVTLVRLDPGQSAGIPAAMQAVLGPLVGRQVTYLFSADGQTLLLQNGEELWASIADDFAAAAKQAPVGEAREVGALMTSLPAAQRDALLTADIRQMLRFAGRDVPADYGIVQQANEPDCTKLTLVATGNADQTNALFQSRQQWQIDLRTGLVLQHQEERWLQRGNGATPERAMQTQRILTVIE